MSHPYVSWWSPDKYIKDLLWSDLAEASQYASGRLLDVGCGQKPYQTIFASKVSAYIGIDARSPVADLQGDFLHQRLPYRSFDTVLSTQVIEHVPDPQIFLQRIHAVLKYHGILILTAPFIGSLHEIPTDYYRFTRYALSHMLTKTGFEIMYIKEEGNWISSIASLTLFYLESTMNRNFLRYPKKILQLIVQLCFYSLSLLPSRFTKPDLCPINYIVVARKK